MSTFHDANVHDAATVRELLNRPPAGRFAVVVRRTDGMPVVIENEPHLRDGTPMPTLYWLVDRDLHEAVSRLEGSRGVHRYEELVKPDELTGAHARYAQRRAAAIVHAEFVAPTGGVGGTRVGVKCLHAHLANWLVTHDDPVGAIVATEIDIPDTVIELVRP